MVLLPENCYKQSMNNFQIYSQTFDFLSKYYGFVSSRLPQGYALFPMRMTIETTYKCNLRCQMCFQQIERKNSAGKKEMTTVEIKKIIDQVPSITMISLTGGEIFTRPDAIDLITYASRHHRCNIVTNAALITPKIARNLASSHLLLMGVSFDGVNLLHDKIRGVPHTFSRALEGIKLIQAEKKKQKTKYPFIDIKTVILPENVDHLTQIFQKVVKETDANFFTISTLKGSNIQLAPPIKEDITVSEYSHYDRLSTNYDINRLEKQINYITQNHQNTIIRFYPGNLAHRLGDFYHNKITPNDYSPCYFPWTSFNISPYGDVFPCIALNVGNARKKSLLSIWNGKKMRNFRIKLKKQKVFPACHGCCNLWLR